MKRVLFILMLFISVSSFAQYTNCVVIEWSADSSSFSVVNYNYTVSSFPVPGLIYGLEVLVKRTPYSIPSYDSRLKILNVHHRVSESYDAVNTNNRMWLETYTLTERSIDSKIASVCDAENWANYKVFPQHKQLKNIVICMAILDKKSSGLTISAAEQAILDKMNAKSLLLWKNKITCQLKIDTLKAGGSVDLDSNWENIDPDDE